MERTLGLLGLGTMGLPMARRLLRAGRHLFITPHRNTRPVDELAGLGAHVVQDTRTLLASADVVLTVVPADAELNAIFLDPSHMAALRPGTVLLDMTTAAPGTIRHIADELGPRGVIVVDAPVSGGVRGAAEGTLTFFCGAAPGQAELVADLFMLLGAKVFHVGGVGDGKIMKSVNQMLAAAHTALTAEALHLVRSLGLNAETAYAAISSSSGGSTMFRNKFMKMHKEDFSPDFSIQLMLKDLGIASRNGASLDLPVMRAAAARFEHTPAEDRHMDIARIYTGYAK